MPNPHSTLRQDRLPGGGAYNPARSTVGARRAQPSGRSLFSDNIWRLLAGSLELSPRESQIVRAVFDDQKESTIAVSLGISPHTVHTHFERLYRKLGVTSRLTLVSRVFVEYLWLEEGHRRTLGIPRQDRQKPAAHG
jgi:DNA-binding NarL/FixJ family response regulator